MSFHAAIALLMIALVASVVYGQTLRQGEKLPSGPPKYYLRDGSPQWICAPYQAEGKPAWSCASSADVARFILKEPPDCGAVP